MFISTVFLDSMYNVSHICMVCLHVLDILIGFKGMIMNETERADFLRLWRVKQWLREVEDSVCITAGVCDFYFMVYSCCCLVTKSCPTFCYPTDCSLPGSSVHGISQERILEWVAISISRGSSWPRDWTHISYLTEIFFTSVPPWYIDWHLIF